EDVGLKIHPNGSVYVFPNIGGFVGGVTVAGILAATMHVTDKPLILVDIGTNGEIVLAHNGRLLATSTAAGPAFEGARITNGMRATEGAIEKVVYADGDLSCNVIGNVRPRGLCGTALIDVTAELLRLGVLDSTGRIRPPEDLPETVPQAVTKRLVQHDDTVDFTLVSARDSGTDEAICLYQKDVRELQLASGAIRAGIGIMLRKAGLAIEDVHEVLLAGAFGNFIRRRNARRIGLLPPLPQAQIRFIGNAASMGAKAVLLSRNFRALADDIALKAEHVDLSSDPEFQMEFGMAMMFPDQELAD
ncbi:MAG: ASKHA domain-containing protein, partial [Candidatus Pacebacteria bacterium]|nr:ASKHA domain-containing protein [Candidatus Paceibacterota bacterium]